MAQSRHIEKLSSRAGIFASAVGLILLLAPASFAQSWEQIVAAGKKEGKVVVAISPSAELRKGLEETFEKKFGIDAELATGPGGAQVRRIVEETKAGISYFDLLVGGSTSAVDLLEHGVLQPVGPYLALPEVSDPKHWWGGHMYADKSKQFIYSSLAYITEALWYNTSLVKPGEIRTYDDLLHPKWKGKIIFHDPRVSGSGSGAWAFLWLAKGETFLEKLAKQDLQITTDRRQLAEAVAKGKAQIGIGGVYFSFLPFVKAGLPVSPLMPEEGSQGSHGAGNITVVKNHARPNAAKVFVNWLLSKEGQEIFTRAMGQATRRLDVDTKWLHETGVMPAKDGLTIEQFRKNELSSQARLEQVRAPAERAAEKFLK